LEAAIVFALTGFGLIACGAYTAGAQLLVGAVAVAAIGLPAIRQQCKRYAIAQVRAILAEPQRAAAARAAFEEVLGEKRDHRLAA
jgi:hypothetical protein